MFITKNESELRAMVETTIRPVETRRDYFGIQNTLSAIATIAYAQALIDAFPERALLDVEAAVQAQYNDVSTTLPKKSTQS